MGWGGESGPVAGGIQVENTTGNIATSSTLMPFLIFTFPCDGRVLAVRIRTTGLKADGTASTTTITAYKLRKATASGTCVTTSGTQMLDTDGGAIAANATKLIDPEQSASGQVLQDPNGTGVRQFAKGDMLGLFITTDATAGGLVVASELSWYPHPAGGTDSGRSQEALGAAQVRTVNEVD